MTLSLCPEWAAIPPFASCTLNHTLPWHSQNHFFLHTASFHMFLHVFVMYLKDFSSPLSEWHIGREGPFSCSNNAEVDNFVVLTDVFVYADFVK